MVAALKRKHEAVKALLEGGADPNDEASFSGTPQLLASGAGTWRLPTFKPLIEGGANVTPVHKNSVTPMHKMANWGGAEEMA